MEEFIGEDTSPPQGPGRQPRPGRDPTPSQGSLVVGGRHSRWRVGTSSGPIRALSLLESRQGHSEGKEPEQGGFQLRPISQPPSPAGGCSWERAPRGPRLQLLAGSGDLGNAARAARHPPLSHLPERSPHGGRRPRASLVTNHRHLFRVLAQRLDAGRERAAQAARGPQGRLCPPEAPVPTELSGSLRLDQRLQDMETRSRPVRWPAASAVGRSRHAASAKGRRANSSGCWGPMGSLSYILLGLFLQPSHMQLSLGGSWMACGGRPPGDGAVPP